MTEHPECDRMVAVSEDSHKLGEFLDWLNAQGIHLAVWRTHKDCDWSPIPGGRLAHLGVLGCQGGRVIDNAGLTTDDECPECHGTGLAELVRPRLEPVYEPYENLLARYFDVDLQKVDEERRAILATLGGEG